jgi:hypothetical protein
MRLPEFLLALQHTQRPSVKLTKSYDIGFYIVFHMPMPFTKIIGFPTRKKSKQGAPSSEGIRAQATLPPLP